jgi:membrane protein involved in colicin uptake
MLSKIYHKVHGESEMYDIDARAAVQKFPNEWSTTPWSEEQEADADAKASADAKAKADADAKARADAALKSVKV